MMDGIRLLSTTVAMLPLGVCKTVWRTWCIWAFFTHGGVTIPNAVVQGDDLLDMA